MSFLLWLGFTAALCLALALPGPVLLLLLEQARLRGLRGALPLALGIALGDWSLMLAAMLGAGIVINAWPQFFTALQIGGLVYLFGYFGVLLWQRKKARPALELPKHRLFWNGFLLTCAHPGSLTFFVAFLPQFFDEERPYLLQLWLFGLTGLGAALFVPAVYIGLGRLLARFVKRAKRPSHN